MESKEEVEITEKDVIDMIDFFTRVPPLMLKMAIKSNMNVVKSFESQIKEHESQLKEEERVKVEKVLEMPVFELQTILKKAYLKTGQKQLKILADPKSEAFISKNLKELKRVLFL
ncbi:hypothetical protein [Methanobacterium ferruginis]|uniref:hypothetical protein n=1 Tax=Methanobacterium ferruginis TaxID=710191 RepID=UPI002573CC65|nr:hypothetical protein [Methanobacterium ferruginis]BDZ69390.1 hypothetical protein GCM10025860_28380 [Methanobacterium ferruginis]